MSEPQLSAQESTPLNSEEILALTNNKAVEAGGFIKMFNQLQNTQALLRGLLRISVNRGQDSILNAELLAEVCRGAIDLFTKFPEIFIVADDEAATEYAEQVECARAAAITAKFSLLAEIEGILMLRKESDVRTDPQAQA